MQKVEAWQTDDGQVFANPRLAAIHEFEAYARSVYDESAVAMMLQAPGELLRRLQTLTLVAGEDLAVRSGDSTVPPAPASPPSPPSNRFGQFTIASHVTQDVRDAVLATVERDRCPPAVEAKDGKSTAYVARCDHFEDFRGLPGSAPPIYDWAVRYGDNMQPIISWSRRP